MKNTINLECTTEQAIALLRERGGYTEQDLEMLKLVFDRVKPMSITLPAEPNNGTK